MNNEEDKMIETLKDLKNNYGVVAVKAEFEAEGSRFNELVKLKQLCDKSNLELHIKIGGCEAVRDLFDCLILDAKCIIAPMVESPFALKKFFDMVNKYIPKEMKNRIQFGITFETKNAYVNMDDMINDPTFDFLSVFTIGRVDLSASYGLTRDEINNEQMMENCKNILSKIKNKESLILNIGGGISLSALDFIRELNGNYGLKRFETRKIVFEMPKALENIEQGLKKAMEFEHLWLNNKKEYYGSIHKEDDERIEMMKKRLKI